MANRRFPLLFPRVLAFLAIAIGAGFALPPSAEEPTIESVFADSPFDKWQTERPRQEVPWDVRMSADRLSFHQRLIANIQVQISGPELLKRSHDERIVLLVQVINGQGVSFRDYGLLELDNLKPAVKGSDVEFAWQAFALPGQYEVSVALWDKKSGEHNFLRRLFHVGAYRNDPLPEMWRGLDAFEFWSTKRDGPEFMFHSDIERRVHLPLATRRPNAARHCCSGRARACYRCAKRSTRLGSRLALPSPSNRRRMPFRSRSSAGQRAASALANLRPPFDMI